MAQNSDTRYSSDNLSSEPNLNTGGSAAEDPYSSKRSQGADEVAPHRPQDHDLPSTEPVADPLSELEDYDQILQELRQTKTEQAVTERRNRKLTLDKVTFGITGVFAVAFIMWGFFGRDSLSSTSQN